MLGWVSNYSPELHKLADKYPPDSPQASEAIVPLTAFLTELPRLRELRLCPILSPTTSLGRAITDTSFITSLPQLRFLSISGFQGPTDSLMKHLETLPALETLDMTCISGECYVSSKLPSLHTLWLSSSSPSHKALEEIGLLPSLTCLDLSLMILVPGSLKRLATSSSLTTLNLSFAKFRSSELSSLTSLTSLSAQGSGTLHFYDLAKLTNLRQLEIDVPVPRSRREALDLLKQVLPQLKVTEK